MINKVILIGNLGRDPEIRHLEGGSAVATFTVATNESYRDKAGEWQTVTEWHNIIAWRNLAERVEKQLSKGKLVYIEGKLTHRKYQDKDGNDKYITEVVANQVRLLERRDDDMRSDRSSSTSTNTGNSSHESHDDFGDDDLPF